MRFSRDDTEHPADSAPRMLAGFGVSLEAEQLYLGMVRNPDVGEADLADRLGLAPARVRGAIDELTELSLLRPSQANGRRLRPVDPEVGLELAVAREQVELHRRQQRLAESRAALAALLAEQDTRRAPLGRHPSVEEQTGPDAVSLSLEQLIHRTQRQLVALAPDLDWVPDKPAHEQLRQRGVEVRVVLPDSARGEPALVAALRRLTELGTQIRTAPILPVRLLVVDQHTGLVPISPEAPEAGVALLRGSGAVAAMSALFEQIWTAAEAFAEPRRTDEHGLDQRERAILERMAQGETDELIAKKMGLSVRTVRRILSDLMTRLDASSRFQVGLRVAQRGWLPN